ncbi:tRNA(Met) cytidine acetyltransferase TmcA [Natronobiforma cellulositropha]|uniref:tRNA(Met) cytidine acetyltransferase TmcA n=1 Tax=Natronobiforma cellulositropha TaxID=1679076 RepID=UPI0021D5A567|nr:tRNA(Met) cytidine acetyltransferase TmcA [Natronobiforma cellulositropha]
MTVDIGALADSLLAEATATNERRALVLAGGRERGYEALESLLAHLPIPITETTLVGPDDRLRCAHCPQANATRLLGTTRTVVAIDAHAELRPNALGSVVGAVDGGGLLVVLTPSLERWPARRDGFDESLAVPPFSVEDVTGHFRRRLVETLESHRGIALVDLERSRVRADGLVHPPPTRSTAKPTETDFERVRPDSSVFPRAAYEACYTTDQADALHTFEHLADGPTAVVLEADRGRGKSSAAGLAAGAFAAAGEDVLVTASSAANAAEVFARAGDLCETLDCTLETAETAAAGDGSPLVRTDTGGHVRFAPPLETVDACADADVVLVDEAAALPVRVLESLLAADRIAFATTVHGYEGAGRGFSVRFRDRLAEARHAVESYTLADPIRYAAGDPLEVWAFRALLLDARPPVDPLVAEATPETVSYRPLSAADVLADEHLLREAFGLLVLAHYRTEPNDLARLLDAPNLEIRALCHEGHVVSVCLLAREGALPAEVRAEMYEGGRVRGNMLPDVLTSQLRDERAGAPVGLRVMRIATHHAVRSRGLGSYLLERVREEFESAVDWLGTGFGATPDLLDFWAHNGYGTVHVSTRRNDASGEHSAIMLSPTSEAGRALAERHAAWFARRVPALCADSLAALEADVVRAVLRSVALDDPPALEVTPHEWRVVAGAAYGPGLFDVDPGPFRPLVVRYFLDTETAGVLTAREERLLVERILQAQTWERVAADLEYHSTGTCMRAFGDALCPLVDRYGTEVALDERERFLE